MPDASILSVQKALNDTTYACRLVRRLRATTELKRLLAAIKDHNSEAPLPACLNQHQIILYSVAKARAVTRYLKPVTAQQAPWYRQVRLTYKGISRLISRPPNGPRSSMPYRFLAPTFRSSSFPPVNQKSGSMKIQKPG